jgi:hypothetical protein
MNQRENVELAELRTHILYIRENIKQINQTFEKSIDKLDKLPCNAHEKKIMTLENKMENIKENKSWSNKKTIAVISAIASIISTAITAVVAFAFNR